jgi:hypothetical protein
MDRPEIRFALLALLHEIEVKTELPISLYEIGPPLVTQGFTQNDILHALYALQDDRIMELIEGNRLQLRQQL